MLKSYVEAEYQCMGSKVYEIIWIQGLLSELGV